MEFKDNLKKLRTEKGLTQAQLAEAIFVSRSTVAKWENGLGLPSVESMALLEAFFGDFHCSFHIGNITFRKVEIFGVFYEILLVKRHGRSVVRG